MPTLGTVTAVLRACVIAGVVGLAALPSCGGKQGGVPPLDGGSSGNEGGGAEGGTCVEIDPSTYDRSCNVDSDCVDITSGRLCDSSCLCGGTAVNKSGEARYQAVITSLPACYPPSPHVACGCECPLLGNPTCVEHECRICGGAFGADGGCGNSVSDGGVGESGVITSESGVSEATTWTEASTWTEAGAAEAGVCVEIYASSYDQTCVKASDCVSITVGHLCDGSCDCGGATINKSGLSAYDAAVAGIKFAACPCAAPPPLVCSGGMCSL